MNKISQKRLDKGIYWERAWSLINGCTKVSEGCQNCWAERQHIQFKGSNSIDWKGNIRIVEENLELPLRVKKPTVWAIWNDLFHEKVPLEFIMKVFDVISQCPQHIFLILTKRPHRARMLDYYKYAENYFDESEYYNNVWLGVTAENQRTTDERIPILLQIPAAVRFVSIEPCLSDIDLTNYLWNPLGKVDSDGYRSSTLKNKIHWVVLGAESGSKKRLISLDAIRNVKDQCQEADVPLFIKQLHIDGKLVKDINKFPEDLRIREIPE